MELFYLSILPSAWFHILLILTEVREKALLVLDLSYLRIIHPDMLLLLLMQLEA